MHTTESLLRLITRPSRLVTDQEARYRATLVSGSLFVFVLARILMVFVSLLFPDYPGIRANRDILYVATPVYVLLYLVSRTRYFVLAGFLWMVIVVIACSRALIYAPTAAAVIQILIYFAVVNVMSGLILGLGHTVFLGILTTAAILWTPSVNPAYSQADAMLNVIANLLIAGLALYGRLLQNRYLRRIKADARTIRDQRADIVQTSKLAALGELSASIAHEVNNPLAIIQGYANKMAREVKDGRLKQEDLARSCEAIIDTTHRLRMIMQSMQTLSRDSDDETPETTSFETILGDVLHMMRENLIRNGIGLTTEGDTGLLVTCRPVQIAQVLLNIIKNAMEAFPPEQSDRTITLGVEREENDTTVISITNNGQQIPAEIIRHITDPFFTTKGKGSGTGLGLSISRRIVESHGGTMEITSTAAKTRFLIRLPGRINP